MRRPAARLAAALILAAAASAGGLARADAPEPQKPVDLTRYSGRWYEIARLHNLIEESCAEATADYVHEPSGEVTVVETCRHAGPQGRVSTWRPKVKVLDPGRNAKLRLTFFPLVSREYWVLDHADNYDWAIVATSNGKYLWLFARRPDVPAAEKALMVERAHALGFDTSKLIYDK